MSLNPKIVPAHRPRPPPGPRSSSGHTPQPETQLGIGPPTDTGFYYDFDRAAKFTPEDLAKIEAKMHEIQARNLPFERKLTPKPDGLQKYKDDWMKHELIEERAGDIFTEYTLGPNFIDFCRGPLLAHRIASRTAATRSAASRFSAARSILLVVDSGSRSTNQTNRGC